MTYIKIEQEIKEDSRIIEMRIFIQSFIWFSSFSILYSNFFWIIQWWDVSRKNQNQLKGSTIFCNLSTSLPLWRVLISWHVFSSVHKSLYQNYRTCKFFLKFQKELSMTYVNKLNQTLKKYKKCWKHFFFYF